jgi:hypothetical protein
MPSAPSALDLRLIDPVLHELAREAYEEGDPVGFCGLADDELGLALVHDNLFALHERGIYEACLLHAFTGGRTSNWRYSPSVSGLLFRLADRDKLRAAADPLPGPGPFTLYRGVAGVGRERRERGFSWTRSLDVACWFATRFMLPDPAVYTARVTARGVAAYVNARDEDEFICRSARPRPLPLSVAEIRARGLAQTHAVEERNRREHASPSPHVRDWFGEALARAVQSAVARHDASPASAPCVRRTTAAAP